MHVSLAITSPIILTISPSISQGQQSPHLPNLSQRPVTTAHQIEQSPHIDGEVLQDELWQEVPAFGDLKQSQPYAGQPASEQTDIRIAFTATTMFMGAVCYDAAPEKLVISDARRDASLNNTDAILFIFDTYHDGQNGCVFETNSLGVQYDAQVDNEVRGSKGINNRSFSIK
ncbi:MAG: hypothetical protein AAF587_37480 [Bacteroidota bacterium]